MHTFDVWAPTATTVELELPDPGSVLPMQPGPDGCWSLDLPDAGHGTDYLFRVDGRAGRPDPRSAWQPDGVHGPSRVFDPARHAWRDAGWPGRDAAGAVVYELHVGTFTAAGTLDAATERLDHLVALGVDLVELMPVCAFPGLHGWGYDGVAPYSVHQPYGGPAALQRFVDACHTRGLGVCLDVVHNHLGPEGNYLSDFGPYFTTRHHTPWGAAVNLDGDGSARVRRYLADSALRWFRDFHVDALRLDAVHALKDDSPRHFLAQLADETAGLAAELGRPLSLVAESDLNDPAVVEPTADGGRGMTAQWSDDVHHAVHAWLTGERQGYYADFGDGDVLARTLTRVFRHAGEWSAFRGRPWGRPVDPDRHPGHRFVAFLQSHDQVGNRARGDRIGHALSPAALAAGAALLLTSAFTPMLFMGEEWGASTPWQYFCDFTDPDLAKAVTEGRYAEFAAHGWAEGDVPDPQDPATRAASVLRWQEAGTGRHAELLRWYTDLLALRRREPDLQADRLAEVRVEATADRAVVRRGSLLVAVNLAGEPFVPEPPVEAVLLAWGTAEAAAGRLLLGPRSVAVARMRGSSPEISTTG